MLPDVLLGNLRVRGRGSGRLLALAVAATFLASGLSACANVSPADNAADFRDRVARAGYDVAFAPEDPTRPGVVAGVVRSPDGVRSEFVFSFGPGPENLAESLRALGTTWVKLGDKFEYWIEEPPPSLTGAPAGRYTKTAIGLTEIGCRVVADRACLR
jgi:hypothetical protein